MISLVTIENKVQLFKGTEPANSIELIQFKEYGFEVVSAKGRVNIGDKAFLVEPDVNLSEKFDIFNDWIKPNGDPKKTRLGKNLRVRAVKFNLHTGDNQPVYSNGILLTIAEVEGYAHVDLDNLGDLASVLGIYKYQEPETTQGGGKGRKPAKSFPAGLYRTDEDNYKKVKNSWRFPEQLIGTEKLDGSSITIYSRNAEFGICSRNINLSLTEEKVVGQKTGILNKVLSWFGFDINIYEVVANDSPFVFIGIPYLTKLRDYCAVHGTSIALRGELVGVGASAGSGNKNNPHSSVEPTIYFYGADYFYNGVAKKMPHQEYIELVVGLGFQHPRIVFNQIFDKSEDLEKACENYFSNNLIEGIVVRNHLSTMSAKLMNDEYDSKK
jgi:RNA ligase